MSASVPPFVLGVVLAMLGGLGPSATPGGRDADVRPRWEIKCADGHCELWLYDVGRTRAWTVPREVLQGSLEPSGADGGVLPSIEPCAAGERRPELVFDPRRETFAPAGTGHRAGAQRAEPKGCLGSPTAPDVEGYSGWLELGHVYDLEAELEGPDSVLPDPPVQLPHHHAGRVVLLDRDRFPDLAGAEAGRFALRVEVVGLEVLQREERMWTSEYFLRVIDCAPGLPEASLDPPSDAVELCAGHVTGAPLSDGRPGPHISWTLYTSTETRPVVAERYYDALGDEGHTTDSDCDTWKRPADPPERIVEVCELAAEGPWSACPPPPEKARSRILISTMARAD